MEIIGLTASAIIFIFIILSILFKKETYIYMPDIRGSLVIVKEGNQIVSFGQCTEVFLTEGPASIYVAKCRNTVGDEFCCILANLWYSEAQNAWIEELPLTLH